MMMPEAWCSAACNSGQGGEVRQFRKCYVHAKRARATTPIFHALPESLGQGTLLDEVEVEQFGIDARGDGRGTDRFALVGLDADGTAILDQDAAHPRGKPDVHAVGYGGFRHGLGDSAHPADGVAPDAFLPVHLAEVMMQENIGGARRVGARIVADDAVEAESGFDRRALEPAVEEVTGGGGEKIEKIPLQIESEGANSVAHPAGLDQFGDGRERRSLDNVRRRLEDNGAQHIGNRRQACLIIVQSIGIPRREFRDLSFGLAAADLQEASIIQWQKVGDRTLDDAQPMDGKIKVPDDLRVQ